MPSLRQVTIFFLIAVSLVSCRRDPASAKKHYLESGDKYMEKGGYKFAVIQYQNAVKIDPKYGIAHYKLGAVYMKLKAINQALHEFRRSVELLEDNQAYQTEYKDSMVQLAQLDLIFLPKDKQSLEDVQNYAETLLKKDPNSFDGYRLTGDLNFTKALNATEQGPTVTQAFYDAAMENYRKADSIKPNSAGVYMQMGQILILNKRPLEAEPYFRKVIDNDKTYSAAFQRLYRLYLSEQKLAEAEALLKEAIRDNPKSPDWMVSLAYHYGAIGRREDMVNKLSQIKAHAKDFENASVYQIVGDFYARMGDGEAALREYREGIAQDVKHKANYQHSIIEVLMRQNKRAEAAEVNNQILKENPKDSDAKSLSATFLLDQGDVNAALTQLQAVVISSPDNAVAHYQLGRAFLASNRPDGREAARQQFEKAIALQQNLIQARLGLAELQVLHNEYDAALDSVQEILKRDPANINAKLIQSQALLGQKKYADSDTLLNAMLKSNPSSPAVYYQVGTAALAQNKPKDAERMFARAYELNPTDGKSLLGIVDAEIQQGQPEKAMAFLQSESNKAPNRLDILLLMGTTAQRVGKFQDSLNYFNKVLSGLDKKNPARAGLYTDIGETYHLMGNANDAIASYQKAREIVPENEIVLANLGRLADAANRKPEARQAYEACLRVNPNNAEVLNNLAYLMAETNADLDVALNYAQKAKGLAPNVAEISDTYGWILLKKSLATQAIPIFQQLVKQVPGSSTYHFHLAKAFSQMGDSTKAAEELREAMKHSPPQPEQQEIQEMLSRLGKG